jgi:hypothetical protein
MTSTSTLHSATIRLRTRAGSFRTFERRFGPIETENGTLIRDREDLPVNVDPRLVWTVLDCDGRLYLSPGFRFVNRIGYVLCRTPWTDGDEGQPDYCY